jgi:tRNA(Ile)-lysidine synthase
LDTAVQSIISDAALLSAFSPLVPYPSAALAVSGGPDSMALMLLARRWAAVTGRSPECMVTLTVDHRLRPESKDEAAFAAREAERFGFRHVTLSWEGDKPKSGIQAAARRARYALMTDYCRSHGIACLATAHTEDDQAETFLMRLRRGSGLDGLAAMAPVSDHDGISLIRPLLGISKATLLAYVRSRGVPYVSDPGNQNASFERVRLRQAIEACASAGITRPALALSALRLGRARAALSRIADELLERQFRVTRLGQGEIDLAALNAAPAEIALRVLARTLALVGGSEGPPQMAKVERLLAAVRGGKRESSLGGCLVLVSGGRLLLYREPGRMRNAPMPAAQGVTGHWDGRFVLTFAAGLESGMTVRQLGTEGWAKMRQILKLRGTALRANRLAALTAPALWNAAHLVAVPSLDFVHPDLNRTLESLARTELVPRLRQFLKPD